jgi:hypothetical protein
MTPEMSPEIPEGQAPDKKSSKLHIGRDALFVVAGVMIGMSAGITPALSVMLVRESVRYLEGKIRHNKEKP